MYGEDDKAGNFFPVELTAKGQEVKTTNGEKERTNAFPDDNLLVAKIAQKTDKLKIEIDGKEVANLDFTGADLQQGAAAAAAAAVRTTRSKKITK